MPSASPWSRIQSTPIPRRRAASLVVKSPSAPAVSSGSMRARRAWTRASTATSRPCSTARSWRTRTRSSTASSSISPALPAAPRGRALGWAGLHCGCYHNPYAWCLAGARSRSRGLRASPGACGCLRASGGESRPLSAPLRGRQAGDNQLGEPVAACGLGLKAVLLLRGERRGNRPEPRRAAVALERLDVGEQRQERRPERRERTPVGVHQERAGSNVQFVTVTLKAEFTTAKVGEEYGADRRKPWT